MVDAPRPLSQRIADTRARLHHDLDLWISTAGGAGRPWLVPLSFLHVEDEHGLELLLATDARTPTGQNVRAEGRARLGLGAVRDLAMIDGTAQIAPIDTMIDREASAYVTKHNSDPRTWADSLVRVRAERIQAWREENELTGRTIMRHGRWIQNRPVPTQR